MTIVGTFQTMTEPQTRVEKTIGETYGPAMKITDPDEADAYLGELVATLRQRRPEMSEYEALTQERANLGYFAGYYDFETRERVEELFHCAHPIFGPIAGGQPTAEEAFNPAALAIGWFGHDWSALMAVGILISVGITFQIGLRILRRFGYEW